MKISALLLICLFACTASAEYAFKQGEGWCELHYEGRPLWRHMIAYDHSSKEAWETTYKTYHHVYDGEGKDFITKGPGGKYTHHRGIYLGWSKTKVDGKSYDFWHVKGGGEQGVKHRKYLEQKTADDHARSVSLTEWETPEGKPVVRDTRDLTTRVLDGGAVMLDFTITVEAVDGDVVLDGDPQHAGFQFRPVNEVTQTKATYTRQATASGGKGDVWTDCNWVANHFAVEGKPVTVVHMNHPGNPGGDRTVYSTRNYGRFGAYARHELTSGSPLTFTYRLLILHGVEAGDRSVDEYEKLFQAFAD